MKTQLALFFVGIICLLSCKPDEPNPSYPISFEFADNGKVIFTNSVNSSSTFNWYVEDEGYISNEKSPYFIFQNNGMKKIRVNWNSNESLVKEQIFNIEVKNAKKPIEHAALNAVFYGKLIHEEWFPLYQNGLFFSNGSAFYNTEGNPETLWKIGSESLQVLLIDRNDNQSRDRSEFLSNITSGNQALASFTDNEQMLKSGYQVKVLLPNNAYSSGHSSKEKLEVLEIKEEPLTNLYSDMDYNKSIWITWHFTNGEEGIKKLDFTVKNQYFFKD